MLVLDFCPKQVLARVCSWLPCCLGGMVWLTWRLIGSSHDPELPWDPNVLFYSTDLFSVSSNKLHVQASKCVVDSGQICPMCSITSYYFSFYLGEDVATWPAHLGEIPLYRPDWSSTIAVIIHHGGRCAP